MTDNASYEELGVYVRNFFDILADARCIDDESILEEKNWISKLQADPEHRRCMSGQQICRFDKPVCIRCIGDSCYGNCENIAHEPWEYH